MIRLNKDLFASVFLMIFSAVMYAASNSIKKLTVSKIGADFAPKLVAIGIFILSIFYLINSVKQLKGSSGVKPMEMETGAKKDQEGKKKVSPLSVIATIGLLVLYIALLPIIGFLITTVVYLFAQMYLLADKKERKIPLFLVTSVVTSVFVYFVFKSVFFLMLPAGILG
ncbi:MAG: tripartite tricarboxylate transporter TctB family protein [Bacillota bacterium]